MCKDIGRIGTAKITDKVMHHAQEYFRSKGFLEMPPVMLSPVTDPLDGDAGSAVEKTGRIEYGGQSLCLTQSMILHKQAILTWGRDEGFRKIFIMSPNVRLEQQKRGKTGRHAFEFSQVDFEIAGATKEDVFEIVEGFLVSLSEVIRSEYSDILKGRDLPEIKAPFKRYKTDELRAKYGDDWEDIMSRKSKQPFWAIGHEREFYDDEEHNYDLILPEGYGEVLSGGQRVHETEKILERMKGQEEIIPLVPHDSFKMDIKP